MSGGELQRVLLSMAVTPVPNLLLLDEPVSGIDRNGMQLFYKNINKLKKHFDLAMIIVSHDFEFVRKYADHVILLDKKIVKEGSPKVKFWEVLNLKKCSDKEKRSSKVMETIYHIIELLLPFSWVKYDFMKNALLAALLITPLFGILGTILVNNRMAFFSDALGHSALTGVAIGTVLGIVNTTLSMLAFAVIFALFLNKIKRRKTVSTDTVISVFASLSVAIGLVILSRGGNFAKYSALLVGDILSIRAQEILLLFIILIITLLFWFWGFNRLLAISVNESLAKSKNINLEMMEDLF